MQRAEEKYEGGAVGVSGGSGGVCRDPASEYGGLVLGADGTPVGVPLVTEPGGAAQGLHVRVHLQGVDLPEGGGGGGGGGGTRGGRETSGGGGHRATLTSPQLTHVHVDQTCGPVIGLQSQTPRAQSTTTDEVRLLEATTNNPKYNPLRHKNTLIQRRQ